MDKRSLLFLIAISITLFGVNMFFNYQHEQELIEWQKHKKAYNEKKQQELITEIAYRTVDLDALPIIDVYGNPQGTHVLGQGVKSGDHLFMFSSEKRKYDEIYVPSRGSYHSYQINFQGQDPAWPTLFSRDTTKKINIGTLENDKSYDLQLVASNETGQTQVFLGEYENGEFKFHLEAPENSALALLEMNESYIPVGFYNGKIHNLMLFNDIPAFTSLSKTQEQEVKFTNQKAEEKYYVIENDYQQLVFSNVGGALVEINLPFYGKDNEKSVVREIEIDRNLKEKSPSNAQFPSRPYFTADSNGNIKEQRQLELGGYYPLLRRSILDPVSGHVTTPPPRFTALNIVSDYPEVSEIVYDVKEFTNKHIVFEAVQTRRTITKTFSFPNNGDQAPYILDASITVNKDKRDHRPLWITTGIPEVELISGSTAPTLQYRITRLNKSEVEKVSLPSDVNTVSSSQPDWLCNSNGFLGFILDPLSNIESGYKAAMIPGETLPSRLIAVDYEHKKHKAKDLPGYNMLLPLKKEGGNIKFRFFAGPLSEGILKTVDNTYSDTTTSYNPDYISCKTFHGWFSFISAPFAKFLFFLMNFFHDITNSWAFSIVLLTVVLRLMLFPLNAWSIRSMKRMQDVAPLVTAIQGKHKKDPKKAQIEVMNLYRERGVNPLMGCFPMLIQMPFLIGMFDLLKSTFELRGVVFIPGWIDNLTAPDVLFDWGFPIFFVGSQLHILPLLLGGVMFIQQKLSSTLPKDKSLWTDQQRQQKSMGAMMTVFFSVMFYHFPSGLNIYWLSSMLLGILQQWLTQKHMGSPSSVKAVGNGTTHSKVPGKKRRK